MDNLTEIQQRIYDTLSDWQRHTRDELLNDLPTSESHNTLAAHICLLRKKIANKAQDVICMRSRDNRGTISYKLVRTLGE